MTDQECREPVQTGTSGTTIFCWMSLPWADSVPLWWLAALVVAYAFVILAVATLLG
jgi:hypothetical protein